MKYVLIDTEFGRDLINHILPGREDIKVLPHANSLMLSFVRSIYTKPERKNSKCFVVFNGYNNDVNTINEKIDFIRNYTGNNPNVYIFSIPNRAESLLVSSILNIKEDDDESKN